MDASPLFVDTGAGAVFAWHHPPATATATGRAVLVCAPWGWDEVASYRGRRRWAEALAAGGSGVLRFDLPGTGDSVGDPTERDQVEPWVRSIVDLTEWLVHRPEYDRVCLLGLGLGALLGLAAVDRGARADEIVVWSSYPRGRRFVRAARAFAGTQSSRIGGPHDATVPPGWLEVNGFVLRADTLGSLEALDATAMSTGSLRRALLLGQDGVGLDDAFVEHVCRSGVDVERADGSGWADLTGHPERCVLRPAVVERVQAWIDLAPAGDPVAHPDVASAPCPADAGAPAVPRREVPITIDGPRGALFGVATDVAGDASDLCAVFLDAGAVRRIGPNRLWVTAARRWADRGIPSLRVDFTGIGDGGGTDTHPENVEALYSADRIDEVHAILDEAQRRWPGRRLLVVGLCAGAYWAFRAAQDRRDVAEAVAVNPGALVWRSDTSARHRARKFSAWKDPRAVRRLLRGQIRREVVREAVRGMVEVARTAPSRWRARWAGEPPLASTIRSALDRTQAVGTSVTLAFSGGEEVERELRATGVLADLARWPSVSLDRLPGDDHTLRPSQGQAAVLALFDEVAGRHLERQPVPSTTEVSP